MTGQSLLDMMELLDNEQHMQAADFPGNYTSGLLALNIAQDYFEAILAGRANLLGGSTGTITTTNATESTAFPTGLLRLDKLQYLDPTSSRPSWDLIPRFQVGGHANTGVWPWSLFMPTSVGGKPRYFWTNGTSIYWNPLPDGTHTVRWYGLQAQTDITALGTFLYPDIVALPLATFATKVLSLGVADGTTDLDKLANQTFGATVTALERFNRTGAGPMTYRYVHDS